MEVVKSSLEKMKKKAGRGIQGIEEFTQGKTLRRPGI